MPSLKGKTTIVTGGNVGLGYRSSLEFAKRGAHVIIACRSVEKGTKAIAKMASDAGVPVSAETIALDLTDQHSIRRFSDSFLAKHSRLDILMNNAGVVNLDRLQRTNDQREMHFATNHLGHFALTAHLFDSILNTESARVVTLSSLAFRSGVIDFEDLRWEKRAYSREKAYGDSKLANLHFARYLGELFLKKGSSAISVAAHPGLTGTERQQSIGMGGWFAKMIATSVDSGVRSQLLAATNPSIENLDFVGPRFGLFGRPTLLNRHISALDPALSSKLWQVSEELTGTSFSGVAN